jgi:divalent metal cation (Fe/Co/Zn/Cd) transporter
MPLVATPTERTQRRRPRDGTRQPAHAPDPPPCCGTSCALNLVVAIAKLIYGARSGAIAITADGIHSMLDASSNVVALIGIRAARRPPDANHPYGHRKYETFAALGIVAMLLLGCHEIVTAAIDRMPHPRVPDITSMGFVILGGTLAINLVVVAVERLEGKRLKSELLLADATHTSSDLGASLLVAASFVAARLPHRLGGRGASADRAADPQVGYTSCAARSSTLSDERRIEPAEVEDESIAEPGVREAHNVRSRGPLDDIHLDLHVLVDPELPLSEAHRVGHRVEARIARALAGVTDVVVALEPALESERARSREGGGSRPRLITPPASLPRPRGASSSRGFVLPAERAAGGGFELEQNVRHRGFRTRSGRAGGRIHFGERARKRPPGLRVPPLAPRIVASNGPRRLDRRAPPTWLGSSTPSMQRRFPSVRAARAGAHPSDVRLVACGPHQIQFAIRLAFPEGVRFVRGAPVL